MPNSLEFSNYVENFALLYLNPNGVFCIKAIERCCCLDWVCLHAIHLSIKTYAPLSKIQTTEEFPSIVYSRKTYVKGALKHDEFTNIEKYFDCKKDSIAQGSIKVASEFESIVEECSEVKQIISNICFLLNYVRQKRYEDMTFKESYDEDIQLLLWLLHPALFNSFFNKFVEEIVRGNRETGEKYVGLVNRYLEDVFTLHSMIYNKDHEKQLTPLDFIQPNEQKKNKDVTVLLRAGFAFLGQYEIAHRTLYFNYMQPESVCAILKQSVDDLYSLISQMRNKLDTIDEGNPSHYIELFTEFKANINLIMTEYQKHTDPIVGCDRR